MRNNEGLSKRNIIRGLIISFLVLFIDQITKIAVMKLLDSNLSGEYQILGFIKFVKRYNTGISFSMFSAYLTNKWFAILIISSFLGLVTFLYSKEVFENNSIYPISMIFGGAIGNLFDRFLYGAVFDFMDIFIGENHFPTFNLADVFIVTGFILLLLLEYKNRRDEIRKAVSETKKIKK